MDMTHRFIAVAPRGQNYAEWSHNFNDGTPVYSFHHIAARDDFLRRKRILDDARRLHARHSGRRGILL